MPDPAGLALKGFTASGLTGGLIDDSDFVWRSGGRERGGVGTGDVVIWFKTGDGMSNSPIVLRLRIDFTAQGNSEGVSAGVVSGGVLVVDEAGVIESDAV